MSYEAIFAFSTVLVTLTVVLSILTSQDTDNLNTMDFLENRVECLKLSNEISSVFTLGNGGRSNLTLLRPANISGTTIRVGNYICDACCNFTNGVKDSFDIRTGHVSLVNNNGSVQAPGVIGIQQHHDPCSTAYDCSADAPLCCYIHGGTVCEAEGHHGCSSLPKTAKLTVSSTTGNTCSSGCSTADLNDRDASYESKLDKGNTLPMGISDQTEEGGTASDVKVFFDYGKADAGISSGSLQIYISDSQSADLGTIYCRSAYTPLTGSGTNSSTLDCEDNPIIGGLNTVQKIKSMYVHIDNEDTGSPQSFKVDWVSVNVTYVDIVI